jgi:hypothetical protein
MLRASSISRAIRFFLSHNLWIALGLRSLLLIGYKGLSLAVQFPDSETNCLLRSRMCELYFHAPIYLHDLAFRHKGNIIPAGALPELKM